MGPIRILDHEGINNDYVINTLGASVSPILGTPHEYSS